MPLFPYPGKEPGRSWLLVPGIIVAVRIERDAHARSLQLARDVSRRAEDLGPCSAESQEHFDPGPVDEADTEQIQTHLASGLEKF